jgi:hypothetical protein
MSVSTRSPTITARLLSMPHLRALACPHPNRHVFVMISSSIGSGVPLTLTHQSPPPAPYSGSLPHAAFSAATRLPHPGYSRPSGPGYVVSAFVATKSTPGSLRRWAVAYASFL